MWRLQIAMILLTRALEIDGDDLAELDIADDLKASVVIIDRCLQCAAAAGKLIEPGVAAPEGDR